MKITKRQLRRIVKEEGTHSRDDLGTNITDIKFPVVVGYEDRSEIVYDQDELDDILDDIGPLGIPYSLDSLVDMEPRVRPVGAAIEQFGESIKITRRQLRRILREVILQEKAGLWDNVHAKRKRGEKPAKRGDKDYPDEKAWNAAQEADEADGEEGDDLHEAEYDGPTPIRKGQTGYGKKQEKVYVKDGPEEDDVKVVRFGDPDSEIRRDNPKAKKSFRARHNCENPGPKTKARYWSCRAW